MTPMESPIFPFTLAGRHFSITPSSSCLDYQCTASSCDHPATHRVLSRATATVEWLCDAHALAWARLQDGLGSDEAKRQER
jgi:hypothetical protein